MVRIPPFRKAIVAFLVANDAAPIAAFTDSDWASQFRWLDRSGLALPLAARLLEAEAISQLPRTVVRALTIRLCDNEERMKAMLDLFGRIHAALADARVSFCCLKGFSLIPEICGFIRERHQIDFDLLIDPGDEGRAIAAVELLGYTLADVAESGEIRLTRSWKKHLNADSWIYDVSEGPALEFHTRLWEPKAGLIDFALPQPGMNRMVVGSIAGVTVPRLEPAWQFVSLVLHIFRHLLDSWVRLLSLHEVAVYLRSKQSDDHLWSEVSTIMEHDTRLSSACVLVLQLVKREFKAELPAVLQRLCRMYLTTDSALWCEHFSQGWLYADAPGTKLSLLVLKQFFPGNHAWHAYLWQRLFPRKTPPRLSDDVSKQERRTLRYFASESRYRAQRFGYHIDSNWQYMCAAVRWKRLAHFRAMPPFPGYERTNRCCDVPTTHFWQSK
jgi:hypothetical protein